MIRRKLGKLKRIVLGTKNGDGANNRNRVGFEVPLDLLQPFDERFPTPSSIGRSWDSRLRRIYENPNPVGVSDINLYLAVHREFDFMYYLFDNPDIYRKELDPVAHYIRAGEREGRRPQPYFDPRRYQEMNADVLPDGTSQFYHWITEGRAAGLLCAPWLGFERMAQAGGHRPKDIQRLLEGTASDLRQRLTSGKLGEMVEKAAEFEPLVTKGWPSAIEIAVPPYSNRRNVNMTAALHRMQSEAEHRPASVVICVNGPRWGGAKRMEGYIADAVAAERGSGEIVVVLTDKGGEVPAGRFPAGVRIVDLDGACEGVGGGDRERLLVEFIRSLGARTIFNVNGHLLWRAMRPYGIALSHTANIVGCMFCAERDIYGGWNGVPVRQFYRHFEVMSAVCVDSHALKAELEARYAVDGQGADRIKVLEAPVDHLPTHTGRRLPSAIEGSTTYRSSPAVDGAEYPARSQRPQVFWSGRFDDQKRLDIVAQVAIAMPDLDFRLWGEPVLVGEEHDLAALHNVTLEGVYASFDDVPVDEATAWLYTSEWDGVPSILLEVGMTELPIVASIVGGTGEVVDEETGWPVFDIEDIDEYVSALRSIVHDPEAAIAKAETLRRRLLADRTSDRYRSAVAEILNLEDRLELT